MKMYETIIEAIEIVRNTWRDRTYTVKDEVSGKTVTGSAYDIYGAIIMHELRGEKNAFWPVNDMSAEECALMDTIYAAFPSGNRPLKFDFELAAQELLNSIVAEVEDN